MRKMFYRFSAQAFAILLLFSGAGAQSVCEPEYSIPYLTMHYGSIAYASTDGSGPTNVMMTIGQPIVIDPVGVATNNTDHSVPAGFWSTYLREPKPALVRASDGDFQEKVLVEWIVEDDRTGPPVTGETVSLYRNGYVYTTLPIEQTEFQDFNVFPGTFYQYAVTTSNGLGESRQDIDVGFLSPNGVITGQIKTPSGTPVKDAKVILEPNMGRSAKFNGDSYVYFFDDSTSDYRLFEGLDSSYTIETWFRSIHDQRQTIFAAMDSATTNHHILVEITEGGYLQWTHNGSSGASSLISIDPYAGDGQVWHHLALVYDDTTSSMTMYMDGAKIREGSGTVPILDNMEIVLGKRGTRLWTDYFIGRLDDFRVWSRARTWDELRQHSDLTLSGEEENLLAYWKFDEAEGETIFDLTHGDQDGDVCEIERDYFIAPVYVGAITDVQGNYSIKGIYYGNGTTFTVIPSKETNMGRALQFDPLEGEQDWISFENKRVDITDEYTVEGWFKTTDAVLDKEIFDAYYSSTNNPMLRVRMFDHPSNGGTLKVEHFGSNEDGYSGSYTSVETAISFHGSIGLNDNLWHHWAVTFDGSQLKLYLDDHEPIVEACTDPIEQLSAFHLGKYVDPSDGSDNNWFHGIMDDIRIWDEARTAAELTDFMHLAFDEDCFREGVDPLDCPYSDVPISYWKFNEGFGGLVTDITGNQVTGIVTGDTTWTDDIASLLGEVFEHFYEPESRYSTLNNSNISVDMVDFTDMSLIPISGFVRYQNTACFQEGVEILIDGESMLPPLYTDSDGKFIVPLEPGRVGVRLSCIYEDHEFAPQLIELPVIVSPLTGIYFDDRVTHKLTGTVAGGSCEYPIIPSQGTLGVTLSAVNGCIEETILFEDGPNQTDYESSDLPPLIYNVTLDHPSPSIDNYFTGDTLTMESIDRERDFIYRSSPEAELVDVRVRSESGAFEDYPESCSPDYPIVAETATLYVVDAHVYEPYGENKCSVGAYDIQVFDNVSDTTYSGTIDTTLQPISFIGNNINLLAGAGDDHPYQNNLQIVVTDTFDRSTTTNMWVFVEGDQKIPGVNFSTTTSKQPWWVLRVPPGDGSSTYLSVGENLCTNTVTSNSHTLNEGLGGTVHAGTEQTIFAGAGLGIFVGKITTIGVKFDIGANFSFNQEWSDVNETINCLETSQTYSTSTDGLISGDDASVFIGGGTTVDMGIARTLYINDSDCTVQIDTVLTQMPTGLLSTYIHSKYYIKNILMPNLLMQFGIDGDQQHMTDYNYWQTIIDTDSTAIATAQPSSLLQIGQDGEEASTISYDAGASLEYSYTQTTGYHNVSTTTYGELQELLMEQGFSIDKVGLTTNQAFTHSHSASTSNDTTDTDTKTVGFILDDDDPGDGFAFTVKADTVFGMPVFELVGGQSSCPYEPGGFRRQLAQLGVDQNLIEDVPPDESAVFHFNLGNLSDTGEDNYYNLSVLAETNPLSAEFNIDGTDYFLTAGEQLPVTISVSRGPESYVYNGMKIQLSPPCESSIGADLGIDPQNSDWVEISVRFEEPCSESNISSPENGWVVTQTTLADTIWVTVNNYNWPADESMQSIDLQYRTSSGGDWFIAQSVPVADLVDDYVLIPFNISPDIINDGGYELRSQAVCSGDGYPGTSQTVTGLIDRNGPDVVGLPEPVNGILGTDDLIRVSFNEDLDCGNISIPSDLNLTNTVTGNPVDYEYTCGYNVITIEPHPTVLNRYIENQILRADIFNLQDLYGNPREEPVSWEFFVNRNPIEWAGGGISDIVIYVDESFATSKQLINTGGSNRSFDIIGVRENWEDPPLPVPNWLIIDPLEGTLTPGNEMSISISLTDDAGFGDYSTTIYASGMLGDEPMPVGIRKLCYPPDWEVNPSSYQYTMSITGELSTTYGVTTTLSEDTFDKVGVFVNGECRGVADVLHFPELELHPYQIFLTVYSNQTSGEELDIHVWDASECTELGHVYESYEFVANAVHGVPSNPVPLTASSQIIASLDFDAGWTWMSLNVNNLNDMSLNTVLSDVTTFQNGDLIKSQGPYAQYAEGSWIGTLDTLINDQMYMMKTTNADTFNITGYPVNVERDTVNIQVGWNWIGYLPQSSMYVDHALMELNSSSGDLIKSQYSYAQFVASVPGWFGSLTYMYPHYGYMLNSQEAGDLVYPFVLPPSLKEDVQGAELPFLAEGAPEWMFDPVKHENSMCVTGELSIHGVASINNTDMVGAFINDECRGVARPIYIEELDQHVIFMMIHSGENGESIEFRAFDSEIQEILYVPGERTFEKDIIIGTIEEPFVWGAREMRPGDKGYVPDQFSLEQNYPNPFNPVTTISYGLPVDSKVSIVIYNLAGQEIKTLVSDISQSAGYYRVVWNSTNEMGNPVSAGIYFYRIKSNDFVATKKLVLLK